MNNNLLSVITLFTNFLNMAFSLWFAMYLLSRSHANQLSFRAIISLIALAFYYNNTFNSMINPPSGSGPLRSLATIIALLAAHDLTHYLLSSQQRRRLYWLARGLVILGVVMIGLVFSSPESGPCDPRLVCPASFNYPLVVIDLYKVVVFAAILYNLWQIKQTQSWVQSMSFYLALLLGASTIAVGLFGAITKIALPRFIPNVLTLAALSLLAYSVAHDRTLVTHRGYSFDLPVTLITIAIIVGSYFLASRRIGLSPTDALLLSVMAIFTHSAYDFVREFLNHLFHKEQHQVLREIRRLGRATFSDSSQHYLRRALAILCHNLLASSGMIAIKQDDQYVVVASLHSLPVGTHLFPRDVILEAAMEPTSAIFRDIAWLAPASVGNKQVGVVGIGLRKDKVPYEQDDLFWLEDIAEEIGWTIYMANQLGGTLIQGDPGGAQETSLPAIDSGDLFTALTYKPDPNVIKCIEEGFRHLHDYDLLGNSPLVSLFGIVGEDHIERGKQVRHRLAQVLEKLRPAGPPPPEPLPGEWFAYTILHDAYVEEKQSREIMARLYIGEGTYYRMRRQALRGITRALFEMGTLS